MSQPPYGPGPQPGPPPGHQPGPPPGYRPGPPPGYQQGPPPGYQQGPPPGYQAAPPGGWQTSDFDQYDAGRVQQQVGQAGRGPAAAGGGTLLTEPVLVVNQRTKLIELNNEYRVFNGAGQPIGMVVQVGQSAVKKAVRFFSELDQFFTHTLEIRELSGQPILRVTRPAKVFKSRFVVESPYGPIGEIRQRNVFGKIGFDFVVGEQRIGGIQAENWRAWNFQIVDGQGREVARITKTFEGIARTLFTTADNYVVHIHFQLPDPLRQLVVASSLCVDTALKQDERGFN